MRQITSIDMKQLTFRCLTSLLSILIFCTGCGKNEPPPGLTQANLDKITVGMTKADVEKILGPPTSSQNRQTLLFDKGETKWDPEVVYRYEDGPKFATITLKEDKVKAKDEKIQGGP
jgi:hypothetical protein